MRKTCLLILYLLIFACTRDREWNNPYDAEGTEQPTVPSGLKAVALNDSTIELTWQDSEGEIGYKVQRNIDSGSYQEIGSVAENVVSFVDQGLEIDHVYCYRVSAFAANGEGVYTDTQLHHTFPAPSNLTLTQTSDSEVRLEWRDNSTFEDGFAIERREGDTGTYTQIGVTASDVESYFDGDVVSGTKYTYRVRAFTASSESPYSNGISFYIPLSMTVTVNLPGGATMEMVWIEPGTFTTGSSDSEGFWLGKYVITQRQWQSVMGTTPWSGKSYVRTGANYPAVHISWNDVQAFIAKLNQVEGSEVYRLPTEAEWEYACRAGTTTRWSFGDDVSDLANYAWYYDNAWALGEKYPHKVGLKLPNPWGLYDMHGNIWEWCQDRAGSSGTSRRLRGGSVICSPGLTSSGHRHSYPENDGHGEVGARLLRIEL